MTHDVDELEREIEATRRDMAERKARATERETLEWCASRVAEGTTSKNYEPPPAVKAPANFTGEWQRYIASRVERAERRTLKLVMEVVGEALATQRKELRAEFERELEREVMRLRNEFLQGELDRERGAKRLKVVTPAKIA